MRWVPYFAPYNMAFTHSYARAVSAAVPRSNRRHWRALGMHQLVQVQLMSHKN